MHFLHTIFSVRSVKVKARFHLSLAAENRQKGAETAPFLSSQFKKTVLS